MGFLVVGTRPLGIYLELNWWCGGTVCSSPSPVAGVCAVDIYILELRSSIPNLGGEKSCRGISRLSLEVGRLLRVFGNLIG